jgi:methyl-accepting chemotaxis protein
VNWSTPTGGAFGAAGRPSHRVEVTVTSPAQRRSTELVGRKFCIVVVRGARMQLSVKQSYLVLAVGGVSMTAMVGGVALLGLGDLGRSVTAVVTSTTAMRNHLDADMMHDAIRADVLTVLAATNPDEAKAALADFEQHAQRLSKSLEENLSIELGEAIHQAILTAKPVLTQYLDTSRALIAAGTTDAAAARQK